MRLKMLPVILVGLMFVQAIPQTRAEEPAVPTKEQAIEVLKGLLAALEAKDYDAAAGFMHLPEGISNADKQGWKDSLAKLIERKEISAAGIEKLAKDAKLTTLAEAAGDRAARMAEKFKVPVEKCYGLFLDPAEAGFYFDGKTLKIVRCDDIGKLVEE